jgi:hypothetical protein
MVAAGTAAVLLGFSMRAGSAEARYGTRDRPLEGQRYETMRSLARHLDESARGALEGFTGDSEDTSSSAATCLPLVRSFARGAADFHGMVDNYRMLPFEVPVRVEDLALQAYEVSDSIRSADAPEGIQDDWESVLAVLGRMELLLAASDVEAPAAHAVAALSGSRLQEFRQLAHDVDVNARAAHSKAKSEMGDYKARGQQFLGELSYFAAQSRDLQRRADAAQVDPQQIGPIVDRLLEDARQADRSMRDARVFTSVWVDSGATITMLHRMAGLVRF